MKILFDQGTPAPLRTALTGHAVSTAFEMGWAQLDNGQLLKAAEGAFEALITTDKNLEYEQNISGRRLAILVLPTTSWPIIQMHITEVVDAVNGLQAGAFRELTFAP